MEELKKYHNKGKCTMTSLQICDTYLILKSIIFNLLTFDSEYINVSCSNYDIESKHLYLSKCPLQIPLTIYKFLFYRLFKK